MAAAELTLGNDTSFEMVLADGSTSYRSPLSMRDTSSLPLARTPSPSHAPAIFAMVVAAAWRGIRIPAALPVRAFDSNTPASPRNEVDRIALSLFILSIKVALVFFIFYFLFFIF